MSDLIDQTVPFALAATVSAAAAIVILFDDLHPRLRMVSVVVAVSALLLLMFGCGGARPAGETLNDRQHTYRGE